MRLPHTPALAVVIALLAWPAAGLVWLHHSLETTTSVVPPPDLTGSFFDTSPTRNREHIIPSLESFPRQLSVNLVVRQVQDGSFGMMQMMGGPQMPTFSYLTKGEVAAAYFNLANHSPKP